MIENPFGRISWDGCRAPTVVLMTPDVTSHAGDFDGTGVAPI
jgi:hypothetical protein